jgi:hypothetical protein
VPYFYTVSFSVSTASSAEVDDDDVVTSITVSLVGADCCSSGSFDGSKAALNVAVNCTESPILYFFDIAVTSSCT